jgi:hypothetical protein
VSTSIREEVLADSWGMTSGGAGARFWGDISLMLGITTTVKAFLSYLELEKLLRRGKCDKWSYIPLHLSALGP